MRKPTIVAMGGGGFSEEPESPVLDDAHAQLSRHLLLRRRPLEALRELAPGDLHFARPPTHPPGQGIGPPQLVEYGPANLRDRVRLELGPPSGVEGLDGIQKPDDAPGEHVFAVHWTGEAGADPAGHVLHER